MQTRYQTGVTDQVNGLDIFLVGAMEGLKRILGIARKKVFQYLSKSGSSSIITCSSSSIIMS